MSRLVATFSFFCASSLPKSKPSIIADDSGSHSWYHARVSPQSSSSPTIVLHWLNVGHELPPLGIYWAKASVVVEEELKWRWRWRWWHLHRGHNRLYRVINRTVLILIAVGFDDRCILQGQLRAEFRKGGKARARLQFPLGNLTICHSYETLLFKCHFYVWSYSFAIGERRFLNRLSLLPVWHDT